MLKLRAVGVEGGSEEEGDVVEGNNVGKCVDMENNIMHRCLLNAIFKPTLCFLTST